MSKKLKGKTDLARALFSLFCMDTSVEELRVRVLLYVHAAAEGTGTDEGGRDGLVT